MQLGLDRSLLCHGSLSRPCVLTTSINSHAWQLCLACVWVCGNDSLIQWWQAPGGSNLTSCRRHRCKPISHPDDNPNCASNCSLLAAALHSSNPSPNGYDRTPNPNPNTNLNPNPNLNPRHSSNPEPGSFPPQLEPIAKPI